MVKRQYLCLETVGFDMEEYGVDFIAGKVYSGDIETGYVDSGENGTSVHLCDADFKRYFVEFIKGQSIEELLADANARSVNMAKNEEKGAEKNIFVKE